MLKEFKFLFDIVLGLPAHCNTFCHVSWCEFLHYLDTLWVQMKILARILCNEASWTERPCSWLHLRMDFFGLFPTYSLTAFRHILSLSSGTQLPAIYICFWYLAELVQWSCGWKFMCPLINLAFQGMVVEVELTAKFCLYCFEWFRLQIIRDTIIFLIIYYTLFFPSFPKAFDW